VDQQLNTDDKPEDVTRDFLAAQTYDGEVPPVDKRQRRPQPVIKADDALTRPSMTMDPGVITSIEGAQDDDVRQWVQPAVSALETLHLSITQIIAARSAAKTDPTLTAASATLKVADYAERLQATATARVDAAHAALTKTIAEYEGMLSRPM
jgi:hypothetical protein